MVAGGADARCLMTLRGFNSLGIMNPGACTPFGADRQGMNIGEGGAFVLIEREPAAGQTDPVYLLGCGESLDAYHMTSPHPDGVGAQAAMREALAQAGLAPADVDHINAHGTGTAQNDAAESKAIEAVFGCDVPVTSTKGYTGHLLGACASTEAVFSILAVQEGWIPASLGADPRDPDIGIHIPTTRLHRDVRYVLSNAFAFGGNNASVLFGRRP